MPPSRFSHVATALACALILPSAALAVKEEPDDASKPVSYFKKVRPIFQAQCQGCHQPAKAKGGYVMTDFARLLRGGETADKGELSVIPGNPDKSLLIKDITPMNGEAEMPKKKPPLAEKEIALIRRWVAEGAIDDTPANARQHIDAEHPPIYLRPPLVTSIDVSPDGSLLAVAGFHEILLWKPDGLELVGRLIGLSDRIQTVRFSPDGKLLAASGGRPAQMGEIQVWEVAERKLKLSVPFGFDTLYGVNWSPDGKLLSFGCPDNALRAIDANTGAQVLQQNSHSDWVLGTAFTKGSDKLVSIGRDMSMKLTDVASQRFIDNLSSITPGALRGGLHSVARHPERDEFLVGGSDGVPQAYRIERKVQRHIGDNALCIRKFPAMEGRIYAVDFAPDGKSLAAASALDGKGTVNFYNYDFDTAMPEAILKIESKDEGGRSAEEKKMLEEHYTSDAKILGSLALDTAIYTLRFSHDGSRVVVGSEDGKVRFISAPEAKILGEFIPVPLSPAVPPSATALK